MSTDKEFNSEKQYLRKIVGLVADSKKKLEASMAALGAFNLDKLKELRENPASNSADFLQFMEMLKNKSEAFNIPDKYKRLEELVYLEKEPYFSRIDLSNKDKSKSYYIGKFGFSDIDTPYVLDWRTKVASIYYKYRYPQKNVKYETPDGIVESDLLLKRTYEIDNGDLIKYYNNDLKLDESQIIADKISERTGGVLEDIIETIQENQHEIIEADPRQVCIVQGTVGSGKSTVAIHKLSHIFFNHGDLIRASRSILIAKNQILVGYLSTLFPKLGIFDINYGTVRDLIYKLLFREEIGVDFDLDKSKDVSHFKISDLKLLQEQISQVVTEYKNKIDEIFADPENQTFAGFVYDFKQSVRTNLSELISDLEEEVEFQLEFIQEHPSNARAELFRRNIKTMKKIIKKITDMRAKLKSETLYQLAKSNNVFKNEKLGYFECLIYILIYAELIGFKKTQKFEYCVVDEGQDFSVLEYALLNKLVINGRMCILGDLNQSYAEEGLTSWDEITDVIQESRHAQKFVLDTNYRSTKPIIDFANDILSPYTSEYLPVSINRIGPNPIISTCPTNNDIVKDFQASLLKDTKKLEKSIGIICMNQEYFDLAEKLLRELNIIQDLIVLRETDTISYIPRAVYLTHFDNCKGLEFSKVYVLGLNLNDIRNFTQAKKAFVAVTRAMDELHVYGIEHNK